MKTRTIFVLKTYDTLDAERVEVIIRNFKKQLFDGVVVLDARIDLEKIEIDDESYH